MEEIKVLMVSRATLFSHPGGDTTQILKTAEYINKIDGVSVTIKTVKDSIDFSQYHLLHLFNISRPADLLGVIKKAKLPYVLSTIFIDYSEVEAHHHNKYRVLLSKIFSPYQVEYIKTLGRILKKQDKLTEWQYPFLGQKKAMRKVITKAKMLLPNSTSEYRRLQKAFSINIPSQVIPNAIDVHVFSKEINNQKRNAYKKFENAVISVGQITPVKNHLALIKALNNTAYNVFIIGSPSSNALNYFEKCRKEAADNITFIPFMKPEELAFVYGMAKVHVLPSWFETTGLVSLEAAYMGCSIVITDKGDQKEYFKEDAYYCNPQSPESILEAVNKAYQAEMNQNLRERIKKNYTWEETAKKTAQVYKDVLSGN